MVHLFSGWDGGGSGIDSGASQAIEEFAAVAGTRLRRADLAAHRGQWVTPTNVTYRERYRLFELPPNPQGLAAQQQLNILEGFDLAGMGHNTADYLHVHIEAKKLAFVRRLQINDFPGIWARSAFSCRSQLYCIARACGDAVSCNV